MIGTGIIALAGTVGGVELRPWDVSRLDDLARLVGAALPDEALTADELQSCCYDDPSVVVGIDDAAGPLAVGAVSVADHHGFVSASVKLLVVRPGSQRSGIGRAVLEALEREARSAGATTISLGGSVPSYLWPAVDVSHLGMLCLAEAAGYRGGHLDMNMSLPVTFRRRPPEGIVIERVLADDIAAEVVQWCDATFPQWTPEVRTAIEQGGCHVAIDDATGAVRGVGCHSVNRAGWVGPMATDPVHQTAGVGSALLSVICTDLMVAGRKEAEISWVGPVRFYAKAGAVVSRVFRSLSRPL